jgi:CHAD domain-containing protein
MVAALTLNPAASARASLAAVLRRWSDVIDANRAGVLDDIDIEYLHELRTAVRGTRSLLSLVPDLFSAEQVQGAAREFAWLGRLTTPLRDLDVTMRELAADLARDPDLEPLRAYFAALRRRALQDVRAGLQSPRGVSLTASWRVALDRVARDEASGGGMTGVDVSGDDVPSNDVSGDDVSAHEVSSARTRRVAGELAIAAYRAIVKSAATVSAQTPADELHRLRRRCKRMRYLLDGYASVYPRESHREVLGALTALQDCLGDIQDVDVRRQQLTVAASALADGRLARTAARPAEALLAIGAVRERRLMIDGAARRSLVKRLARFRGAAIQQCIGELAGAPRSGAPA